MGAELKKQPVTIEGVKRTEESTQFAACFTNGDQKNRAKSFPTQ